MGLQPGRVAPPQSIIDNRIRKVSIKGYPYKIHYRDNISDLAVIEQIFFQNEYKAVPISLDARLIIDCGSNIGCSVVYFLNRFPNARIVAIEPDDENYALLLKNVEPYGDRVIPIKAGVWSHATGLKLEKGIDGLSWSLEVRPVKQGEVADLNAITIDDAVRKAGGDSIDLLKLDVEGAEAELFAGGYASWLDRAKVLAIELHGPRCEKPFYTAMSDYHHKLEHSGEYVICSDIRHKSSVQGHSLQLT